MQIIRNRQVYDVCIVGSGAGGGMAAKVLTEAGAQVLMLEAGPTFDTGKDGFMFKWAYETPRRGAAIPTQQFGEFDAAYGGWTIEGEPYTNAPGSVFDCSARACSAAGPTTGGVSRCDTDRMISAGRASTDWVTTGPLPTRT